MCVCVGVWGGGGSGGVIEKKKQKAGGWDKEDHSGS